MKNWMCRAALLALAATVVPACGGSNLKDTQLVLSLVGGQGTNGTGGSGGDFEIYHYHASDVKLLREGSFDTTFNVPAGAPYLGTNPRIIDTNTTLTAVSAFSGTPATAIFQILKGATNNTIRGDNGTSAATGLWIKPGVTLTVPAHYDTDGTPASGTFERVYLELDYGIFIEGTLAIGKKDSAAEDDGASPDSADAYLYGQNLVIGPGGAIRSRGESYALGAGNGGRGGFVELYTSYALINRGTVDTRGGDGDNGGDAGGIGVYADYASVFNLGTYDASGGNALDVSGWGGDGADVDVYGSYSSATGGAFNSGRILAQGGNGPGGGGDGGDIYTVAYYVGGNVNTGLMDASGGHATVDGDGGDAGYVEMDVYGGSVRATGTLRSNGGNGAGNGDGGDGYGFYVYMYEADDYPYYEYNTMLGIYVGANIEANGGRGENGGDAGEVYIYFNDYDYYGKVGAAPTVFVGYGRVNLAAGDGSEDGGSAGSVYLDQYGGYINDDYETFAVGGLVNELDFIVRGGSGGDDDGGDGGYFEIYVEYNYNYPGLEQTAHNSGNVDLRGGSGADEGGDGGDAWIYAYHFFGNTGHFDTSGGSGRLSAGGDSGYIDMISDDMLENSGDLTANGGSSVDGDGGYGDGIDVYARRGRFGGRLVTNGGSSVNAIGGDGGDIWVFGGDVPTTWTGVAQSLGGSGSPAGSVGEIWILGLQIQ